jgi:hypothetical protein
MSFHVDLEYVNINQEKYNLSFIILKNLKSPNSWTQFYRRTSWNNEVPIPPLFFQLDLANFGQHIYHPCAPFYLSEDECSTWLTWSTVKPNSEGDEIRMLQLKIDPTGISKIFSVRCFKQYKTFSFQFHIVTLSSPHL